MTAWIADGHVEQFQAFGHAETNWTRWQTADRPYAVEYVTFDSVWPSEVRGWPGSVYGCRHTTLHSMNRTSWQRGRAFHGMTSVFEGACGHACLCTCNEAPLTRYYNNKMSFCWTIKMLGTGFVVHPLAFVLHYAHQRVSSTFASSEGNKAMVRSCVPLTC